MTADSQDNFEYMPAAGTESAAAREHYWAVAIGLQQVDGLEVSPYLRDVVNSYIVGARTLDEAGTLIRAHHGVIESAARETGNVTDRAVKGAAGETDTIAGQAFVGAADTIDAPSETEDTHHREADLVSHRIAELLASKAFLLSPDFLTHIHRHLFQDLDPTVYHAGEFKTERMVKQEEILNGDSVLYADPTTYAMALKGAFEREQAKDYGAFDGENFRDFCQAIAFLWQIHPFHEGNTRTIAVFSELYLTHLGFDISNEPFEHHARYYRDALVRSMYRNAPAKIFPTLNFLMAFYENAIGLGENELDREALACQTLFDDPTLLRNVSPANALRTKPTKDA